MDFARNSLSLEAVRSEAGELPSGDLPLVHVTCREGLVGLVLG